MTAAQRATLFGLMAEIAGARSSKLNQRRIRAIGAALGTCASCEHSGAHGARSDFAFCAAPPDEALYPFVHKLMPLGERCTGYTPKEGA